MPYQLTIKQINFMNKKNQDSKKTNTPAKPNAKKSQPIVIDEPVTAVTETLEETLEETPNTSVETPIVETPNEPVKVSERRVFWHKACKNEKESTMTKMKPEDVLTLTDGSVTDDQGNVKTVLSLKRGKRIYYLTDYTPEELTIAKQIDKAKKESKEAEKKAKETPKDSNEPNK